MTALPTDFNDLIHELRGRALEELPPGARTVLSGGCPDRAYFEWFASRYPSPLERHLGIELFRDPPPDLPEGVEYVRGNLGDLAPIADASIDLVFAGQVVEHLWADDLSGFLLHSHRVLRTGGRVVIDSPNRLVTLATGWHMPEHTLELTPVEARELLVLAGFDIESMHGLWLCADPATGEPLGLHPDPASATWTTQRRADAALDAPDAAFVWWAVAVRSERAPAADALRHRARELFATKRPTYFGQLMGTVVGTGVVDDGRRLFLVDPPTTGAVLIGPYVAFAPGNWSAVFTFEGYNAEALEELEPSTVVATLDVVVGETQHVVARRDLCAGELPRGGEQLRIAVEFELPETSFAGQARVFSTGTAPLAVAQTVDVVDAVDAAAPPMVRRDSSPLRFRSTRSIRAEQSARALARKVLRRVRPGA
jgi:SAM-dependent methyltransferase